MRQNDMINSCAVDRHPPKYGYHCRACSCTASSYNCNACIIDARPEAFEWDWWMACDNADCVNSYGEGFFQFPPDWIEQKAEQ